MHLAWEVQNTQLLRKTFFQSWERGNFVFYLVACLLYIEAASVVSIHILLNALTHCSALSLCLEETYWIRTVDINIRDNKSTFVVKSRQKVDLCQ